MKFLYLEGGIYPVIGLQNCPWFENEVKLVVSMPIQAIYVHRNVFKIRFWFFFYKLKMKMKKGQGKIMI